MQDCKILILAHLHVDWLLQSPELIARLNKLKAEQEQAEYNRMITNVDRKVILE